MAGSSGGKMIVNSGKGVQANCSVHSMKKKGFTSGAW